jgi:hypothetical protein
MGGSDAGPKVRRLGKKLHSAEVSAAAAAAGAGLMRAWRRPAARLARRRAARPLSR